MQSFKLNDDYYLTTKQIIKNDTIKEIPIINHIWLYDRSGSMSPVIKELCNQMKQLIRTIDFNNTITLMWFSGPNQKGTILKGFKLHDKDDYNVIDKVLDSNNTTIGTTCFSESLSILPSVIDDLSCFSSHYAFTMFTDGYPIVNDIEKEIKSINNSLSIIQEKNISNLLKIVILLVSILLIILFQYLVLYILTVLILLFLKKKPLSLKKLLKKKK